jgi:hypothetical protein
MPGPPAQVTPVVGGLIDTAPLLRSRATFVASSRSFAWPFRLRLAVRSQAPGDRVEAIERACRARARSQACIRVLAPVACRPDNPIDDGAFSCRFAKRYSPCYQDYESEACVLFRDAAANPCLRLPGGPSCFRFMSNTPEGCSYPPRGRPALTPVCAVYVAVLTDLCQTSPEVCPGPFGGSQEALTVESALDGDRDDELPIETAAPELEVRPAVDVTPTRTLVVRSELASTGLELGLVAFAGVALLLGGLGLRGIARPVTSHPSTARRPW